MMTAQLSDARIQAQTDNTAAAWMAYADTLESAIGLTEPRQAILHDCYRGDCGFNATDMVPYADGDTLDDLLRKLPQYNAAWFQDCALSEARGAWIIDGRIARVIRAVGALFVGWDSLQAGRNTALMGLAEAHALTSLRADHYIEHYRPAQEPPPHFPSLRATAAALGSAHGWKLYAQELERGAGLSGKLYAVVHDETTRGDNPFWATDLVSYEDGDTLAQLVARLPHADDASVMERLEAAAHGAWIVDGGIAKIIELVGAPWLGNDTAYYGRNSALKELARLYAVRSVS